MKAPNYKLIQIYLSKPDMETWTTLVGEASSVLEWTACVNNNKLEDVKNKLYVHNLSDGKRMAEFPLEIGTTVEKRNRPR
uniref:Peptidase S9A N-terminal domain-containing protein n=1 Tax=Magallana gigas TaxID=29159 RepID=A0A8W8NND3_MAGGI